MSATVSATGAPSRESARGAALDVRDRQRGFTGRTVQTGIFGPDRREPRPQEPFLGRFLRRDRAECLKALESISCTSLDKPVPESGWGYPSTSRTPVQTSSTVISWWLPT